MKQRVLVTGGTGFLGGTLARKLHGDGHDVTILARSKDKMPEIPTGMKYVQLDISSKMPDVINYDVIYHCASTVNEYNFLQGSPEDITSNCMGTYHLLEAIRKLNPWTRLVFISTFFVVGDLEYPPATEETLCRPKGLYGVTKLAAEQMCKSYSSIFDLDIVIARLTNVYGVNQPWASQRTAAFNWMVQSCVEDKMISLYDNGKIRRDYIYIDDAVSAIETVAAKGQGGQLYFVGSGMGISFREMVDHMIRSAGGGKVRIVESPGFHKRVGIGDFWINNQKIRSLGWEKRVSIEEGIAKTVSYYRRLLHV